MSGEGDERVLQRNLRRNHKTNSLLVAKQLLINHLSKVSKTVQKQIQLFLSTSPWVAGVRGAPWTCLILCFLHSSLIVLLLNSFPMSECSIDGKPIIQNKLVSATATASVCLFFRANSHE